MEHKIVQDVHILVARTKRRQTKTRKVESNMSKVTLDEHCLVRFSRKTGKIDTTLEALGTAQLKLWALSHCPKTKDIVIFHKTTGNCIMYLEGTEDFPKIFEEELGNIESLCPGLLRAVNTPD